MIIWIDAQISPSIAAWINRSFIDIEAKSVQSLGLRDADDFEIFSQAKLSNAVIMSKDSDFISLIKNYGSPPKLIWISFGNTSNAQLRKILKKTLIDVVNKLQSEEEIVEISDQTNL